MDNCPGCKSKYIFEEHVMYSLFCSELTSIPELDLYIKTYKCPACREVFITRDEYIAVLSIAIGHKAESRLRFKE